MELYDPKVKPIITLEGVNAPVAGTNDFIFTVSVSFEMWYMPSDTVTLTLAALGSESPIFKGNYYAPVGQDFKLTVSVGFSAENAPGKVRVTA